MSYADLDSLRQSIEKISADEDQCSTNFHHRQLFRSIHEQVIFLLEFADDFPYGDSFSGRQLESIVDEAQEVIEHFISGNNGSPPSCIMWKTNFTKQLRRIRKKMDSIARQVMEMEKNGNTIENDVQIGDSSVAPASNINDVVGLDDDLIAIKSRLCGGPPKLEVISIVGMAGIGKSTLSAIVYNDRLTIHHFDVRGWVTVSQDYSTQEVVAGLVNSMKEFVREKIGQSREESVYRSLMGRRYLIVLDDIWSESAYDDVRRLFPDNGNGSRIVLTTRRFDVAAYAAGHSHSPPHEMRFMSIEQSWELLRKRVFADSYKDCLPELENIGKKIAESCGGLPLATVVIAGLLSTVRKNSDSWQKIANNVSSIVGSKEGQCEQILSLSYTHLPQMLRPCFLYMGGFPEDHEIHVSELVKFWVAEGFLSCSEGSSKSQEELAEDCLEGLVSRSLVLVSKRKYNGRIKSCSLHDLVRDLCIRKAQESNFFVSIMDRCVEKHHFIESIKDQNRISVKSSSLRHLSATHCSTIHTLMCFPTVNSEKHRPVRLDCLKSAEVLRVLDAQNFGVQTLPVELLKLLHLRYLAIGCFEVPSAISRLQNLQTLILDARSRRKVRGRPIVSCLPPEIWMMPQLRHLICHSKLPGPEGTTRALENMQTLSLVSNDVCFEGILEKIPNIKKLGVDCSCYDSGIQLNDLAYQHQLEVLKLCNGNWQKDCSISFPRVLRKLTLSNMSLPWSEMSVVGSLPNLQVLKLRDFACIGSTWETSEGEFGQLQFLLIETSRLQHWVTETYHFPMLKFLLLHDCWCLNEIPEAFGQISTLELIHVTGHARPIPKSLAQSAQNVREEQLNWGNEDLQVRCPLPESCVTNDCLSDEGPPLNCHEDFFMSTEAELLHQATEVELGSSSQVQGSFRQDTKAELGSPSPLQGRPKRVCQVDRRPGHTMLRMMCFR